MLPTSSGRNATWQRGPLKRCYPTTTLLGVTSQKTSTWIFSAVKTSKSRIFHFPFFDYDRCSLYSLSSVVLFRLEMPHLSVMVVYLFVNKLSPFFFKFYYGLNDQGSRVRFLGGGGSWEFYSSPPRPERLWGPSSLLSNGYQGLFPWG
jgi:hypothetical protein